MSALRFLGFSYFAVMSGFALAVASADQTQLRLVMDTSFEAVSVTIGQSIILPLLTFARAKDEIFFDPPPGT